jgi:hypothetical protein
MIPALKTIALINVSPILILDKEVHKRMNCKENYFHPNFVVALDDTR